MNDCDNYQHPIIFILSRYDSLCIDWYIWSFINGKDVLCLYDEESAIENAW